MESIYAYMRATDDLADEPGDIETKRHALLNWRERLLAALQGEYSHRVHAALHATVTRFHIPAQPLFDVIDGVEMDLQPLRFETWAELEQYCHRVASSVGLACVRIWGLRETARSSDPLEPARAAGVAFQLTNILRDLAEDRAVDHIYLPNEDLVRFRCPSECWGQADCERAFQEMLAFQIARARQWYRASAPLAEMLQPAGRAVFELMSRAYQSLLNRVEAAGPGVLTRRVRLTRWTKLRLLGATLRPHFTG
jgi:phytoene synthase